MNLFSPNNVLMTIVLVFLTIVLAIIVIPFLIIVAVCCLFSYLIMGISPVFFFNRNNARRSDGIYEDQSRQGPPQESISGAAGHDDTIECEVISARTVENEENTPENL